MTLAEIVPCGRYPIAAAKDLLCALDNEGLEPISLIFPEATFANGTKVVPLGHFRIAVRCANFKEEATKTAFLNALDKFSDSLS